MSTPIHASYIKRMTLSTRFWFQRSFKYPTHFYREDNPEERFRPFIINLKLGWVRLQFTMTISESQIFKRKLSLIEAKIGKVSTLMIALSLTFPEDMICTCIVFGHSSRVPLVLPIHSFIHSFIFSFFIWLIKVLNVFGIFFPKIFPIWVFKL